MARKTLDSRLASASAKVATALDAFETAASALDKAAAENDAVSTEASAEIERLTLLAFEAQTSSAHARRAAAKVRDLVA